MQPKGSTIKVTLALAAVLIFAIPVASAAGPTVPWTTKDMKTAIRGIGYPRPHPKKLACRGSGAQTSGSFTSFRCVATYTHHRRSVFFIGGQGEGGWLCAGKTLTGCVLLRHGFITKAATSSGLAAAADIAARGYMMNKYGGYQAKGFCKQQSSSPPSWSCPFVEGTVTLTLKAATGGYVSAASVP